MRRPTCPAANLLAAKAWNAGFDLLVMRHARGDVPYTGYGPVRGDGTRPHIVRYRALDTIRLTARHPDGRAFVALWIQDKVSEKTGRPGWSLDMAHRPGRWAPLAATATELTAYVLGATPATEELEDAA